MIDISVNIPVFGNYDFSRLEMAIRSIQVQTGVSFEIVLSEQNPEPLFEEFSRRFGIEYVFSPIRLKGNLPFFSPGHIRNKGLAKSVGAYAYISDSDVLLPDPTYLSRIYDYSKTYNKMLNMPKLVRIEMLSLGQLYQIVEVDGISVAISKLKIVEGVVATLRQESECYIKKVVHHNRLFTCLNEDFVLFSRDPEDFLGMDTRIWSEVFHYGTLFGAREQFFRVGGYHERFVQWGHEDLDVKWKLRSVYDIDDIHECLDLFVYHMDHSKDYVLGCDNMENRYKHERRVIFGYNQAISEDLEALGESSTISF